MRRQAPDPSAADLAGEQISTEQLAALSHEFRTPLSGVLGMARLLEGTRLSAEQRAYVSAMRDSGEHLLGLVNELLDFARLGAGKIELREAPVEIEALLRAVCELLSPRAHEKGLEIAWASPAAGAVVMADESRLRQILLNFAGNAVKFTANGGVLLNAAPAGEGRWRFTVADTGPGVSDAARDLIFEAFAQSEASHQLTGSGLGLAIARRLALAMGGEVGVEAGAEGGAVFWFEAPLATQAPRAHGPAPLTGLQVGVASPNPIIRQAAARQIEACGGTPVTAADVEDLLPLTGPQDVLLLDHALGRGGRKVRRPFDRPAIILLAPEERDRIARYRASGFGGYLIKPLRRASLAERVLAALQAAPDQTHGPEDDRVAPAAAPGARVLLVEDNPVNALLARTLLTREGCSVDHAMTGQEALAALKVGAYDLVLMDMRLPDIPGEETTRRLRAAGIETPVVALTANAFQEDREACMAAGMNDFLVKPLAADALRQALARWARKAIDGAVWTEAAGRAKFG